MLAWVADQALQNIRTTKNPIRPVLVLVVLEMLAVVLLIVALVVRLVVIVLVNVVVAVKVGLLPTSSFSSFHFLCFCFCG